MPSCQHFMFHELTLLNLIPYTPLPTDVNLVDGLLLYQKGAHCYVIKFSFAIQTNILALDDTWPFQTPILVQADPLTLTGKKRTKISSILIPSWNWVDNIP